MVDSVTTDARVGDPGLVGTARSVAVDVAGNGISLSDVSNGVSFDLNNDGTSEKRSWTKAQTDHAWLCLDRNGNGLIDNGSELFGNFTQQPSLPNPEGKNGFLALAEYDKAQNGGNGDGAISDADAVFPLLRLWQDANHNGLSEPSELHSLSEMRIATLHLSYKLSSRMDRYGNRFRYRAKIDDTKDIHVGRWAWDVFLSSDQ